MVGVLNRFYNRISGRDCFTTHTTQIHVQKVQLKFCASNRADIFAIDIALTIVSDSEEFKYDFDLFVFPKIIFILKQVLDQI